MNEPALELRGAKLSPQKAVSPPSGRHVWWHGTPLFTFEGDKVRDLRALGDIHHLVARLEGRT